MVSKLVVTSDNPSSNPINTYSFFFGFVFKNNENRQEEAGIGPFKNKKGSLVM